MNERMGIIEERQATADKYARFINPPRFEPATPRVNREAAAVLADVGVILARRILTEKMRLAALPRAATVEAERFQGPAIEKEREPVPVTSIRQVQTVFLDVLFESGYRLKGGLRCKLADLTGSVRSREISWPRQVCMALVRAICPGPPSTPEIGQAFGGKDHTSIMHALRRTPQLLLIWPQLGDVHSKVLAAFQCAPHQSPDAVSASPAPSLQPLGVGELS